MPDTRQLLARNVDSLSVAFLSAVMFVVGFGGGIGRLSAPLGSGDALPAYSIGNLWSQGAPFGNATLGYPFGIELRYFPTADVTQNAFAGLFGAITNNPFLGMNLVFAASFPVTALLTLWVFKITGLHGPVAVFFSLAFTAIPFHWLRVEHVYLATLYSAVLAVGLALLVGTGQLESRLRAGPRIRTWLPLLGIIAVIAASGIYYACFAMLLCGVAALYRFARGARFRSTLIDLIAPASIAVLLVLVLLPSILWQHDHPALSAVAGRLLIESVAYSGVLAFAVLPAPVSLIPGLGRVNDWIAAQYTAVLPNNAGGVVLYSNGGSFFTVAALIFVGIGLVLLSRRRAVTLGRPAGAEVPKEGRKEAPLGLVGILSAASLLFFIPWGVNFLFAAAVTKQLRAWDRMLPILFLLLFVAAAVVWRELGMPLRGKRVIVAFAVCLVLLGLDGALPYRSEFDGAFARGTTMLSAGEQYGAALNAAIPGHCAVLTLPYIAYPESAPVVSMGVYDPYWLTFANPEKEWSFAAMRDTLDSAWQESLGNDIDASAVADLEAGGFCAVHVDLHGYTSDDGDRMTHDLTALLGPPVATGFDGNWLTFALPQGNEDADFPEVKDMPEALQTFYFPPDIESSGAAPEVTAFDEWWWIDGRHADFEVSSIIDEANFTTVSGELMAADCAGQEVVATLRSGDATATTTVVLGAGESHDFSVYLAEPTESAVLTVTSVGASCYANEGEPPRSVALYNPTATF